MKQDRQKLEDVLDLIVEEYSVDTKIQEKVISKLIEKGISRGRTTGIFTKVTPLVYLTENELCLFVKHLYEFTHELKIKPNEWFTDIELSYADSYQKTEEEKVKYIMLHNVDQISESQWLCTKETYQNIGLYMGNGLLTYNPNTQRPLQKRKSGNKIIESIDIDPDKVAEIANSMLNNTFCPNAITWNIRKIKGIQKFKYDSKARTLLIEPDGISTSVDIIDGANRTGGMLKCIEKSKDIQRVTSIYIHHVTEERANEIIEQESLAAPIPPESIQYKSSSNINMLTARSINEKQKKNEMFNRIGLNEQELKVENKLVTFDTLSKTIDYVYDLKNLPITESENVEEFLIKLFNICIGVNYESFNSKLTEARENSYVSSNNMFIGYVVLGELVKQKYGDDWKNQLTKILKTLDFSKTNDIWKKIGIENNVNKKTMDKISDYFKSIVAQWEVQ